MSEITYLKVGDTVKIKSGLYKGRVEVIVEVCRNDTNKYNSKSPFRSHYHVAEPALIDSFGPLFPRVYIEEIEQVWLK